MLFRLKNIIYIYKHANENNFLLAGIHSVQLALETGSKRKKLFSIVNALVAHAQQAYLMLGRSFVSMRSI